jgi:GTPase SAR1 family protein
VKLLMLGTGDSGKTTMVKQIRLIYLASFTREERLNFRPVVYSNLSLSLKTLANLALRDVRPSGWTSKRMYRQVQAFATSYMVFAEDEVLSTSMGSTLVRLWEEPAIRSTFARYSDDCDAIVENMSYLATRLHDIVAPGYVPTDLDILYARQRTRAVVETRYSVDGTDFTLVDVGGQRNQRAKWIHSFEDVQAIIFICAISEYNQRLEEDTSVMRMHESLNLFEGICRYPWFRDTTILLFLNKIDLFHSKIERGISLRTCFPRYRGPSGPTQSEEEAAAAYVEKHFSRRFDRANAHLASEGRESLSGSRASPTSSASAASYSHSHSHPPPLSRSLVVHFTCATDTSIMRVVFDAVRTTLLAQTLGEAYL